MKTLKKNLWNIISVYYGVSNLRRLCGGGGSRRGNQEKLPEGSEP